MRTTNTHGKEKWPRNGQGCGHMCETDRGTTRRRTENSYIVLLSTDTMQSVHKDISEISAVAPEENATSDTERRFAAVEGDFPMLSLAGYCICNTVHMLSIP